MIILPCLPKVKQVHIQNRSSSSGISSHTSKNTIVRLFVLMSFVFVTYYIRTSTCIPGMSFFTARELAHPSLIAQAFKTCADELSPVAQAFKTCADELLPIAQAVENMCSSCSSYSSLWQIFADELSCVAQALKTWADELPS